MSNETSSFSSLSRIPVLTGSTDYARWSLAIKNAAMMADVWEYLNGTETYPEVATEDQKPNANEKAAIKVWKKANSKALGLMGSTCTKELQLHIDEYRVTTTLLGEAHISDSPPTAAEVWSHLATKYKKKDGVTAAMDWGNLIKDRFKSDVRMEEQIASHLSWRSKIALSGFTFPDWQFALLILLRLPDGFEFLKSSFLDGLEDPTKLSLDTVIKCVIDRDNHTTAEVQANAIASSSKAPSSSTKAKEEKKKGKKKEKSKEKKEKKSPPGACHHCGQEGHWNRDCPKKKKPDQPSSSSLNVVETEASASDAECDNILCYLSSSTEDWLMDSGATEHLTPWRSNLSDYVAFPESHQTHVVLGDSKTRLRILGKGKAIKWVQHPTTHEFTKVTLMDVQHVQGITRCFLSLSTFDDKGFELHMKSHQFKLSKGKAALYGHQHGKLYIAPMYRDCPTPPSLNSAETALSANLWHKRMGHMNYEALKTAGKTRTSRSPVLGIKLDSTPLDTKSCTGCLAGKSKRRTYNASQNRPQRSQFPIERIHSDLVGPIQTASINGHRFAITFTCDKTTHTWCFPLKSKDQTLGHFKRFVTEVEAQTGLKIRFF